MRDNAAPRYQQAKCLRTLSRADEAHAILSALVALPADAVRRSFARVGEPERGLPITLELGSLELERQHPEAALSWLEKVLEVEPRNLEARTGRAAALRSLGRTDEAERDLAIIRETRTAMNEADRLVDLVNRESHDPHVAERYRIGELFLRHENARKGEFWLLDALRHDPDYAPAHALLAEYYRELARTEPAYAALADEHQQAAGSASSTSPPDAGSNP
jgi:Tfp pilus assembly protein PilF